MIPKAITITGVLTLPDNQPTSGTIQFRNSVVVSHATQDALMLPDTIEVVVPANGVFSVAIPSTDDPAWSPLNYSWEVTVRTPDRPTLRWSVFVPFNSPGDTISLGELAPIPAANGQLYALVGHTHSGFVTEAELTTAITPLVTDAELATAIDPLVTTAELTAALSPLVTDAELTAALSPLVTDAELTTALSTLATDAELAAAVASLVTDAELATALQPLVTQAGLTTALDPLVTEAELTTALNPFVTDAELTTALAALPPGGVVSVNGENGVVTLSPADVGADPAGSASAVAALSVRPSDHGFVGWMFDPALVQAGTILATAGLSYVFRIKATSTLITNINMHFTSGGTGLTAGQCFASLHNDAGAQLGITADQAANWVGGGYKTCPLITPVAVTPGAWYKVRVWFNGTTGPTLSRGVNSSSVITNAGLSAPNFRWSTADSGMTTAALAPANIGTMTGAATGWWLAVS